MEAILLIPIAIFATIIAYSFWQISYYKRQAKFWEGAAKEYKELSDKFEEIAVASNKTAKELIAVAQNWEKMYNDKAL